jgi:hypothetical protein
MSNFVRRWVITDPYDTNPTTNTYHFPRNPREMTSLHRERAVSSLSTTNHKILLYEGQTPAKSWTFSGSFLHMSEYDDLREWIYDRKRRLIINDHYGRNITCVLTALDAVPKRRIGYYYSHEYTVTALVLDVSDPTIGDQGPTS